jgi:hypothetical protein
VDPPRRQQIQSVGNLQYYYNIFPPRYVSVHLNQLINAQCYLSPLNTLRNIVLPVLNGILFPFQYLPAIVVLSAN